MVPLNCQYEITEKCNQDCSYCYNNQKRDTLENDAGKIAERIAKNGIFYCVITGGEPFLSLSRLSDVAETFRYSNMDFSVNTNLTLTKQEDIKKLKEKGLCSILTSIVSHDNKLHDRVTKREGSFERLMIGVEAVKKENVPISLNMVVTRLNKEQVFDTGKYLVQQFGNISFCATPKIPSPGRHENNSTISSQEYVIVLDDLLRLHEEYGIMVDTLCPPLPCVFEENIAKYSGFLKRFCVGGRTTFTVSANGDVRPCSHSTERYGNILNEDLEIILGRMEKWRNSSLVPQKCNGCDYKDPCRGGCRVAALALTGKLEGEHPYFKKAIKLNEKSTKNGFIEIKKRKLKIPKGRFRYREEENGLKIVYLNPKASAGLSGSLFKLFRVLLSSREEEIEVIGQRLGLNESLFYNALTRLHKSGLIEFL